MVVRGRMSPVGGTRRVIVTERGVINKGNTKTLPLEDVRRTPWASHSRNYYSLKTERVEILGKLGKVI